MDPVVPHALRESYLAALDHSNALTDRISTDQFSASYESRPDWVIGPFERDESLTFRLDGQWEDPTGAGWTSEAIFNPTVIERGDELHLFYGRPRARSPPRPGSVTPSTVTAGGGTTAPIR